MHKFKNIETRIIAGILILITCFGLVFSESSYAFGDNEETTAESETAADEETDTEGEETSEDSDEDDEDEESDSSTYYFYYDSDTDGYVTAAEDEAEELGIATQIATQIQTDLVVDDIGIEDTSFYGTEVLYYSLNTDGSYITYNEEYVYYVDDAVTFVAQETDYDLLDELANEGEEIELTEETDVETDDDITDAVLADYIRENVNTEYTGDDFFELINVIVIKQTLVDGSCLNGETTLDGIVEQGLYADALLSVIPGATGVYNLSNDSEYMVSYANTMFGEEDYELLDIVFARYNNDGEVVDGCIYDEDTGLVYIPKELYFDDDGAYVVGEIQVQFLQATDLGMSDLVSAVKVSLENGNDDIISGSNDVDIFSFEAVVQLEAGLDTDNMSVSVNGIPVDNYTYDSETGELIVPESSAVINSVYVKVENETLISTILDLFSPITAYAATVDYGSGSLTVIGSSDDAVVFSETPSRGDCVEDSLTAIYGGGISKESNGYVNYSAYSPNTSETIVSFATALNSGSGISNLDSNSYTYVKTSTNFGNIYNYLVELDCLYGDEEEDDLTIDFSNLNINLGLFCSHVSNSLGDSAYQTPWVEFTLNMKIRVLKITDSYVVLGFLGQKRNTQAAYGVAAFYWESIDPDAYGYIDITKVGYDSEGNKVTDYDNYSRNGAVYTVYTDADCTTVATTASGTKAKLKISEDNGNASAIKMALQDTDGDGEYENSENIYYVKETKAPSGYYIDTTVYTVCLTANGVKTNTNTKIVYYKVYVGEYDKKGIEGSKWSSTYSDRWVVYDTTIEIDVDISKICSTGADYSRSGIIYTVYSGLKSTSDGYYSVNSSTGQPNLSNSIGTFTCTSTGSSNTLTLAPGYYYILETQTNDYYIKDTIVYRLRISVTKNTADDGTIYYKFYTKIMYCSGVTYDSSGNVEDYTWSSYGTGNTQVYDDLDSTKSATEMYVTVTHSGTTPTIKLYSAKHGKSTTLDSLSATITFSDDPKSGTLTLSKSGNSYAQSTAVTNNYAYSLSGAVYYVYTNSSCTSRATDTSGDSVVLTTTSDGTTNTVSLSPGTYYIKEISASPGYQIYNHVYSTTISNGGNKVKDVTEPVDRTTGDLRLVKVDEDGNTIKSDEFQFTLKYEYYNGSTWVQYGDTLTFQTNTSGYINFSSKDYLISGTNYDTNSDGNIVYYSGRITITEIEAPDDYLIDEDVTIILYLSLDGDGTLYLSDDTSDSAYLSGLYSSESSNGLKGKLGSDAEYKFTTKGNGVIYYYYNSDKGDYRFKYVNEGLPDVRFKKVNSATGDSVTGVVFRLYGTSDDGEVINMYAGAGEDETGWVIFESVPLGTYYLTESDSGGYVTDTTIYEVTVRSKNATSSSSDSFTVGTSADMYCITITVYSGSGSMDLEYDEEAGGYIYYAKNIGTIGFYINKVTPQGTDISGVTFRLTGTSDYGTYYSVTTTSDSNGVSFADLEPGTYYLTETSVANAFPAVIDTNSDTKWTVVVKVDGKIYIDDEELSSDNYYTYEIVNIPYYGFGIYKTTETGKKAYGVTFQLSGLSNYNHYYNESVEIEPTGYAYFEDIEPGTYTLIETEISDDAYPTNLTLLEDTVWIVEITDEGKITITEYSDDKTTELTSSSDTWEENGSWQNNYGYYLLGVATIINPVEVNLEFYKIASVNNEPISGVVFRLYDAETGGQKYDQKATSSSEGKVKFTGLTTTIGIYYLVEVNVENSSPKAMLDSTVYTVTVTSDGVTVTGAETATRDTTTGDITLDENGDVIVIPNDIYYYLTVIKRDKYTALTIEGVTFRLWNSSGTYDEEVTTGEDGIALFDELESGYYFLQETAVPTTTTTTTDEGGNKVTTTTDNYWLDETEHLVYVDADEGVVYVDGEALNKSYEYTMYNKSTTKLIVYKQWLVASGNTNILYNYENYVTISGTAASVTVSDIIDSSDVLDGDETLYYLVKDSNQYAKYGGEYVYYTTTDDGTGYYLYYDKDSGSYAATTLTTTAASMTVSDIIDSSDVLSGNEKLYYLTDSSGDYFTRYANYVYYTTASDGTIYFIYGTPILPTFYLALKSSAKSSSSSTDTTDDSD